jgi:hypothetical protein
MKDGEEYVVQFASRSLRGAEKNYHTTEKECLAVYWAVKEFRPYLWGRSFVVYTDHSALTHLLKYEGPTSRLTRWSLALRSYNMEIKYRKGSENTNADVLSRYPWIGIFEVENQHEIAKFQKDDVDLKPCWKQAELKEQGFIVEEGVLYKMKHFGNQVTKCLVVPVIMRAQVLRTFHDHQLVGGHLGMKKSWSKLQKRYWWPGARKQLQDWIKSCEVCAKAKSKPNLVGELMPIQVHEPWHTVGVDVLGPLPISKNRNRYVLVFTDYLTKWVEAFALPNYKATTVAEIFVKELVCRHGAPSRLLSDRGSNFMSEVVQEVLKMLKTQKVNTTSYHPRTDGLTERFNRTLVEMLKKYANKYQDNWDEVLPLVLFAYRTAEQSSTKFSPFYLMYGREAKTPIEAWLIPKELETMPLVTDYAKQLHKNLTQAVEFAKENIERAQFQQKFYQDWSKSVVL